MIIRNELVWTQTFFGSFEFKGDRFYLCPAGVRKHFDIGHKEKFTFCVSDERPAGRDYYELGDDYGFYVTDIEDEVPMPISFDAWAYNQFPAVDKLYVWIEL